MDKSTLSLIDPTIALGAGGPSSGASAIAQVGEHHFVASLQDVIAAAAPYQPLMALLCSLSADDRLDLLIDSPGGDLITAITLTALIEQCKGQVTAVALGKVQSAGSFLFSFAKYHKVMPGAQFMFHGATMGMQEKAGTMRDLVTTMESYVHYSFVRSMALGVLTPEEYEQIKETQATIFIPGWQVIERMAAVKPAEVVA